MLTAFVASRLLVFTLAWVGVRWIKHGPYYVSGDRLWDYFYRWDALWFGQIVANGYTYSASVQSSVGFFPLLPLCIRALQAVTGMSIASAGFLISNAALLIAAILLRRLIALDFPPPSRVAQRTAWFLLFSPMTFFHSSIYSESLFLMLSIGALLFARQKRWALTGCAGALVTAARANSMVLALPLLWEAFVASKGEPVTRRYSRWWLAIVPAGLVAYGMYLHLHFGDALAFLHAQPAFHRNPAAPWTSLLNAGRYSIANATFFIGSAIVAVVLCVLGWRLRLRVSYQIYTFAMLLLCLSSTLLESLPRYLSVVFPFYLVVAIATVRVKGLYLLSLALSIGVMAVCLMLFVCGYFMI